MNNKIQTFDFFRVIGSVLIFMCHTTLFDTYIGGGIGVEMFFVLSGFVMTLGYGNNNEKFIPYIKKRLNKLYPLYFITLVLGLLYMILILDFDLVRSVIKFPIYIICAQTMTPLFSATGFNSPSWYVATLIWIYVLFFVLRKLNFIKLGGVTLLYALLILSFRSFANELGLGTWLYYFSPYARVLDFMLGVITANLHIRYSLNITSKWGATVLEAIALIIFTTCIIYENMFNSIIEAGIIICIVLYIFSQKGGYISAFLRLPIFRQLSKHTYPFYLIHYLVIMTITKLMNPAPGFTIHNLLLALCMLFISVVLSLILSKLSYIICNKKITFQTLKT